MFGSVRLRSAPSSQTAAAVFDQNLRAVCELNHAAGENKGLPLICGVRLASVRLHRILGLIDLPCDNQKPKIVFI